MSRGKIYSIVALSCMMAGCFVCSPVFAENPIDINIVEVVDDGAGGYKPWQDIVGAMPGMTYSAIPRVRNDGLAVVEVRMCLSESATNGAGETIDLPASTFGITINEHWIIDATESVDAMDPAAGNCYKYDTELAVGAMTEPIFTEITLNSELGNEYENSTFNLHLEADAKGDAPDDKPVVPDIDADAPGSPDTGSALTTEKTLVTAIPYVLGTVAVMVLVTHLLHGLLVKK